MTTPTVVHDLALRLGASTSRITGPVSPDQTGRMQLRLDAD